MSSANTQRRLAAILAADVVGYSRLMGQDEAGTLAALKALRTKIIDPKVAEHSGRIFNSPIFDQPGTGWKWAYFTSWRTDERVYQTFRHINEAGHAYLAASCAFLNRVDEARVHAAAAVRIAPEPDDQSFCRARPFQAWRRPRPSNLRGPQSWAA
jgi:class 3 adenylate cyclase